MGSIGTGSNKILSGQQYQNEYTNIFIKGIDSKNGTVRYVEGFSPLATNDIQEIPIKNLKDYMKKYDFKFTNYWDN